MTTSTSPRGDLSLPPATTFCPTERELTDLYLHRKITDVPLPNDTGSYIHVADVYSAEPEKLAEQFHKARGTGEGGVHKQPVWYFFSPERYVGDRKTNARGEPGRKSRTIDGEGSKRWWHSEKGDMPVNGGSEYGGYGQHFTYKVKNPSSGKVERAGWIMWEYGISPEHGGGDLVLCKIHPSPRAAALEAAEPASDAVVNPKKRKAPAGDDHAQDSIPSARPRHTDNNPVWYAAAGLTDLQSSYQAAPPPRSIFLENIEQDCWSSYQLNDVVMPIGDLAVPPWPPAAQPEDDASGIFQQTVTADEVPRQYYHEDGQLYASLGEEQPLLGENQNYNDVTWVDVEDPDMYGAAGFADQAAPALSNFFENVEQDLAVPPWPPAAQPEDDAAGLLQQQTVTAYEVPRPYYQQDGQLYASLGEEQPLLVENQNYNDVTWVNVEDPEMYGAADFADQATPLSNFFENVEQDFWYQHDGEMPVDDLAVPAAQLEDAAATGLLQTVTTVGEVPQQNYNNDGQMYASLGEEQPEPDNTAAGEAIYGLPCPVFSTGMIRRCNDDLMMPWQSPSSTSMAFGLY